MPPQVTAHLIFPKYILNYHPKMFLGKKTSYVIYLLFLHFVTNGQYFFNSEIREISSTAFF